MKAIGHWAFTTKKEHCIGSIQQDNSGHSEKFKKK